jgi:hypothetical protein
MNSGLPGRITFALLTSFTVWAGAEDLAQKDTDVPALLDEAPAVDAAAEAWTRPGFELQAKPDDVAESGPATEDELMPQADLEPGPGAAEGPAPVAMSPRGSADRLELDATSIRGNQELPKVLYIVPWQDPELGDLVGKPVNSLVDEVLAPVDREVFRRQIRYFNQLYGQAGEPSAGP